MPICCWAEQSISGYRLGAIWQRKVLNQKICDSTFLCTKYGWKCCF